MEFVYGNDECRQLYTLQYAVVSHRTTEHFPNIQYFRIYAVRRESEIGRKCLVVVDVAVAFSYFTCSHVIITHTFAH